MKKIPYILLFIFLVVSVFAIDYFKQGGTGGGGATPVDIWVDESGDTMSGNLNMDGNNITNIDTLQVTGTLSIPAGSIINSYIADNAVTTAKILNGTIIGADLGDVDLEDLDDVPAYPATILDYVLVYDANAGTFSWTLHDEDLDDFLPLAGTNEQIIYNNAGTWTAVDFSHYDLGDLGDVTAGSKSLLWYSGGAWTQQDAEDVIELFALKDVDGTPSANDFLKFNGTIWQPHTLVEADITDLSLALDDISDVNAPTPSLGQFLRYSGSNWVPYTFGYTLALLSDTDISSPQNNQFLRWNTASNAWINSTYTGVEELNDLSNVTTAADRMLLVNAGSDSWDTQDPGDFLDLYELKDVEYNVATIANNAVLKWNNVTSRFEEGTDNNVTSLTNLITASSDDHIIYWSSGDWTTGAIPDPDLSSVWLKTGDPNVDSWMYAGVYGMKADADSGVYKFSGDLIDITGDNTAMYFREYSGYWGLAGILRLLNGDLQISSKAAGTIGSGIGSIYAYTTGGNTEFFFKDDNQAITQITEDGNIRAPLSIDSVYNYGGNIDFVAGANMTITPNDGANTITFAATTATPAMDLDDLTDVIISSPVATEVLKYNGTNWVNAADSTAALTGAVAKLDDLQDVGITASTNGHFLVADNTNTNYVNRFIQVADLPAHASTHSEGGSDALVFSSWEIEDLGNVDVTGVSNLWLLEYDGSVDNRWEARGPLGLAELTGTHGPVNIADDPGASVVLIWDDSNNYWTTTAWIDELNDVDDVTITSVATNDMLIYNGAAWVNTAHTNIFDIADMIDVATGSLTNGDILVWNSGSSVWTNSAAYSYPAMDDISDTGDLSSVATNQILKWNGASWVAAADAGAVNLDDLGDVTITAAATNDIIIYNGAAWVDAPVIDQIGELTDVTITSADTNDLLVFTGAAWVDVAKTGLLELGDISTVSLGSLSNGQFLVYDTGVSMWTNKLIDSFITDSWVDEAGDTMTGSLVISNTSNLTITDGNISVTTGDIYAFDGNITVAEDYSFILGTYLITDDASDDELTFDADTDSFKFENFADFRLSGGRVEATLADATSEIHLTNTVAAQDFNIDIAAQGITLFTTPDALLDLTDFTNVNFAAGAIENAEIASNIPISKWSDVDDSARADGYVLQWTAASNAWLAVAASFESIPDGDTSDDILYWTGSVWTNTPFSYFNVGDLGDVDTGGAADGKVLKYQSGTWVVADDIYGSITTLDDLSDVYNVSPSDKDIISFVTANNEYVNLPFSTYDANELGDVDYTAGLTTDVSILQWDGSNWSPINLTNQVGSTFTDVWVDEAGDTMTGALTISTGGLVLPDDIPITLGTGSDVVIDYDSAEDWLDINSGDADILLQTTNRDIYSLARNHYNYSSTGQWFFGDTVYTNYIAWKIGATYAELVKVPGGSMTYLDMSDWTDFRLANGVIGKAELGSDINIDKLSDVDTTTSPPSANQYLKWNGSFWVPATIVTTVDSMDDIGDTGDLITGAQVNDILKWDGDSWELAADEEGSGSIPSGASKSGTILFYDPSPSVGWTISEGLPASTGIPLASDNDIVWSGEDADWWFKFHGDGTDGYVNIEGTGEDHEDTFGGLRLYHQGPSTSLTGCILRFSNESYHGLPEDLSYNYIIEWIFPTGDHSPWNYDSSNTIMDMSQFAALVVPGIIFEQSSPAAITFTNASEIVFDFGINFTGLTLSNVLDDVHISGLARNDILQWTGAIWTNSPPASIEGLTLTNSLADVTIGSLSTNDYIVWTGTTFTNLPFSVATELTLTNDLADVSIGVLSTNDLVQWTGATWTNLPPSELAGLTLSNSLEDVTIGGLTTNDILQWTGSIWTNSLPSDISGFTLANTLEDVTVASLSTNDILQWTGSVWTNVALSAGVPDGTADGDILWWDDDGDGWESSNDNPITIASGNDVQFQGPGYLSIMDNTAIRMFKYDSSLEINRGVTFEFDDDLAPSGHLLNPALGVTLDFPAGSNNYEFYDGWESGDSTAWTSETNGSVSTDRANTGTYAYYSNWAAGAYAQYTLSSAGDEVFVRIYVNIDQMWTSNYTGLLWVGDADEWFGGVGLDYVSGANPQPFVISKDGASWSDFSTGYDLPYEDIDTWVKIELYYYVHNTSGIVKVWVDGELRHTETGDTTDTGNNANITRIAIGCPYNSNFARTSRVYYDDGSVYTFNFYDYDIGWEYDEDDIVVDFADVRGVFLPGVDIWDNTEGTGTSYRVDFSDVSDFTWPWATKEFSLTAPMFPDDAQTGSATMTFEGGLVNWQNENTNGTVYANFIVPDWWSTTTYTNDDAFRVEIWSDIAGETNANVDVTGYIGGSSYVVGTNAYNSVDDTWELINLTNGGGRTGFLTNLVAGAHNSIQIDIQSLGASKEIRLGRIVFKGYTERP